MKVIDIVVVLVRIIIDGAVAVDQIISDEIIAAKGKNVAVIVITTIAIKDTSLVEIVN